MRRRLADGGGGGVTLMWYLTRGSGAVTLLLLTTSLCLGISGRVSGRDPRLPRFAVASLHRNLSLLAVVFLAVHVGTTLADSYAPVSVKDTFVPFLSAYRPLWLGLGAVACDLLLALIVTSLLRVRLGLGAWRLTHWLAYACWPIALLHALGTGSDPRAGWMQSVAAACGGAVAVAVVLRLTRSSAGVERRLALGAAAAALVVTGTVWYDTGPGATGWAARAGTPASLLHHTTTVITRAASAAKPVALPSTFSAQIDGLVSQSDAGNGLVDVHLDGNLAGGIVGRLRVVLQGVPLGGGGVSMTSSGVAFAARGTQVFEGNIIRLEGTKVSARVRDGSGRTLDLVLDLRLSPASNALTGTVHGRTV
jgi:DMSO/TMAO reductase YedYZ heme-binding membrane subunit